MVMMIKNRRLNTNTSINSQLFSFLSSRFDHLKSTFFLLLIALVVHLFCAWQWPLLNDESYYWDWGRNLHLSYVDAPPAVSWVAFLSAKIFHYGSFSARFLVPFLNLFTGLFLIQSAHILAHNHAHKRVSYLSLIIIFVSVPIFNVNGIVLMPDAPLLFACAGTLYFALKSCERIVHNKKLRLPLLYSFPLGFFIGLGIDSKYQAAPLAVGIFLAIACIRGVKNTSTCDVLFWILTIGCALLTISPLILWNIQNHFASFLFQGQHGFSDWNLNLVKFFIYMFGVALILMPWYFYLSFKQVLYSLKQKDFFRSLDCIPIFAFFSIFLFIAVPAMGKKAQEHWITPAFLFLIPLIAVYWEQLTFKQKKLWRYINICSLILIMLISTTMFTRPVQTLFSQDKTIFGFPIQNIHDGLYHNFFWADLKSPMESFKQYLPPKVLNETKYIHDMSQTSCTQDPYLATFSWRWASQFAFYVPSQPRVFAFDLNHSSYYSWRDHLSDVAGCRFFVIAPAMFDRSMLKQIMKIESVRYFNLTQAYIDKNINMVIIEGVMKDKKTLNDVSTHRLMNVMY